MTRAQHWSARGHRGPYGGLGHPPRAVCGGGGGEEASCCLPDGPLSLAALQALPPPSPRPGGLALPAEMPFGGGVSLAAVSQAPGGEQNSFKRSLMDAGHEVCERTWKWGRRSISQLGGVDE